MHVADMLHSKWVPRKLEHVRPIVDQVYMLLLVDMVAHCGGRA